MAGSFERDKLHLCSSALWTDILVAGKDHTAKAATKGKMSQIYRRMIIDMHPWTARAKQVFFRCIKITLKAKHGSPGLSRPNGCCFIMKAIKAGRNLQKIGRLSKCELSIRFFSYIIQDRGSPFDWVVYIRQDAIPILMEDPFLFNLSQRQGSNCS